MLAVDRAFHNYGTPASLHESKGGAKLKLYWVGGPTFVLELGAFRLLADPVLGDSLTLGGTTATRQVLPPDTDLGEVDYVVISRNRGDHADEVAGSRFGATTHVLAPRNSTEWLGEIGFANVQALDWWDDVEAKKDGETIRVTAVPTSFKDTQESHGFLFQHESNGVVRNVYWTGDTLWFSAAREIKARYDKLDLLVPVVGAVGGESNLSTLSGKEAMQFVFMAQPKRIVPVGHHTFSHYTESVDDFKERIGLTMYEKRLIVLAEGESFER